MTQIYNYLKSSQLWKITILIGVFSLIIGIFSAYQIQRLAAQTYSAKTLYEHKSAVFADYKETLTKFINEYQTKINSLKKVRPSEDEILTFIEQIENIGTKISLNTAISIKNSGAAIAKSANEAAAVNYSIGLRASLTEAARFSQEIESQLPYLIDIESFAYNPPASTSNTDNVQIKLTLYVK